MREVSQISVTRVTSKPHCTLQGVQKNNEVSLSSDVKELEELGKNIKLAISLAQDVCTSLETHLRNLNLSSD